MSSCSESINEPKAKRETHKIEKHNDVRTDNYYWMRLTDEQKSKKPFDQQTQAVLDYINEENDYTRRSLKQTETLQNEIFDEIIGRIKKDDNSVPYYKNGYFYYIVVLNILRLVGHFLSCNLPHLK